MYLDFLEIVTFLIQTKGQAFTIKMLKIEVNSISLKRSKNLINFSKVTNKEKILSNENKKQNKK